MTRNGQQSEARRGSTSAREVLVAVALRLFLQQGYRRTSIQQIVDTAGLTKGAFYHYFDSKDDLLLLAHESYLADQLSILGRVREAYDSPAAALRQIIVEMVLGVNRHRGELALFLEERRSLTGIHFDKVRAMRREFEEQFVSVIVDGIRAGELRHDEKDALTVALSLLGMITWTYQWMKPASDDEALSVAQILGSLALDGLERGPVVDR